MEESVEVHGVPLQIAELTGEPGDAVLCHPALLHAQSMNCSTVPRIMRRTNVRRKR
jgi:ectoine hydroxylase-related dioxygenase (phytanoyl-CoA dioxygenase family)